MTSNAVYVTGLPSQATQDDVMDFFTRIGSVASVQMPEANSDAPVCVTFDNAEDVASAVSISGSDFHENIPIQISAHVAQPAPTSDASVAAAAHPAPAAPAAPADGAAAAAAEGAVSTERPARTPSRRSPNDITNKVAVTRLRRGIPRKVVHDLFAPCGEIDDFSILDSRGTAFVGFTTEEAFEKALKLDGTLLDGEPISVERRKGGRSGEGKRDPAGDAVPPRVVVSNVPADVTNEELRAFFSPDCGMPTDIYVRPGGDTAFMAFATDADAEKAIAKTGQEMRGNAIVVTRRQHLVCYRCKKFGHREADCRQPYCRDCRVVGHNGRDCPRQRGGRRDHRGDRSGRDGRVAGGGGGGRGGDHGSGDRRRRRSDSLDRDRRRRRRSDSPGRDRRRRHHSRSRSRSPPRRRHHSHSRSPPRGRR